MGLFRLFWIPPGVDASQGTYVRYPWQDMLRILALESHRAGCYVVGEDLGTVEPQVREELAKAKVLSYRLVWFEDGPPSGFPRDALAAVTTHDLPTVAGLWSGSDLAEQQRLELSPNEESTAAMRSRLRDMAGLSDDDPVDSVAEMAYELLATAPSRILTATLDDALCVEERPNVPGTTDERPNWSIALPVLLEDIEVDDRAAVIAATLNGRAAP
jgi:4-alpha-glucanotransferase